MEIIPYEKKNTQISKYQKGEINPIALKYARRFHEICYAKFKNINEESGLFNLFLETFNPYSSTNQDTQLGTIDEMIDAMNMFDDILVALSSEKGLNLCKVFLRLERSRVEPLLVKPKKYLIWDF